MRLLSWVSFLCIFTSLPIWAYAFVSGTGAITPSGLIINVVSADLITTSGKRINVFSGSYNAEFTRSGQAFAAIPLTSIQVPNGHYSGISVTYNCTYQAKLNGDKYRGPTQAGKVTQNDPLYTTSSGDGRVANSVTTTAGTAVYVSNIGNAGSSGCNPNCSSQSTFIVPACVAPSSTSCAGEQWVSTPNVNLVIDLYLALMVDGTDLSLAKGPAYPYAMLGEPGAAIHLVSGDGSTTGNNNITLLFAQDGSLAFLSTVSNGNTNPAGPGGGTVPGVTLASGGSSVQMVMKLDTSTGRVQFAQGGCPTSGSCTSSGLGSLDNIFQSVNSGVTYSCTADTTGALGFSYTGGDCSSSTAGTMKVARIVDPNGILKLIGTSTPICSGTGGVCAATSSQISGTDADGYL